MIRINSKVLVRILTDLRRALGIAKSSHHPVSIAAGRGSITVRMQTADSAVSCQVVTTSSTPQSVLLPVSAFAAVQPSARQDLTISIAGETATIESNNATGVRATVTEKCVVLAFTEPDVKTPDPEWRISNPSRLGLALQQAASIADPTSRRYSLGCIRLRGSDGQVSATDGRQVFAASGFALPVDEVMIPAAVLGRASFLANCSSISVGRSAGWVSIACASGTLRWQIDSKIQTNGRFPDIDRCIPRPEASRTVVSIGDGDAKYLMEHLDRLLGKPQELTATTLDLVNDRESGKQLVQLRARRSEFDNSSVIEVTLDDSTFDSVPMRVAMDHHLLLNALRFGHRCIHLQSPSGPAFCHTRNSDCVWAIMHESLVIGQTPTMQLISTRQAFLAA